MIEAIKNIGENLVMEPLNRDKFLDGICKKVPSEKENGKYKQYVVILDFDTIQNKIKVDIEPILTSTEKKYLFVGNVKANKSKIYISTTSLDVLLTEVFYNICKKADNDLKKIINPLINNFFISYSIKEKKIIQPDKFDFFQKKVREIEIKLNRILSIINDISSKNDLDREININKIWKEITGNDYYINNKKYSELSKEADLIKIKQQIFNDCKKVIKNPTRFLLSKYTPQNNKFIQKQDFKKELDRKIKNLKDDLISSIGNNFTEKNIAFFTIKIDGNLLCQTDEYKQMIYNEKITNLFKEEGLYKNNYNNSGTCSICGNQSIPTTSNVTNLDFKFYVTEKKGFSSNLDNKFTKNYNICRECYQYLMVAENFIDEKLKSKIGKMDVYLIPQFILKLPGFDINDYSDCLKNTNEVLANIESMNDLQQEWKKFIEYAHDNNNSFIINYLFYRPSGKGDFKILKLIKNVPPSRLDLIKRIEELTIYLIDNNFNGDKKLKINLNRIYNCIPIKVSTKKHLGTAKYLDIIDAIFSDRNIDYRFLINQFIEVLRLIKFETDGYNIWNKNSHPDLTTKTIQLNILLLFFKKLSILGGIDMENLISKVQYEEMIPNEIKNYWKNLELYQDERKKALFLLGYLIGEIGHRQRVKDIKNKPILNKINFQGMGKEKIIRILDEIPDKLRQYDILQYKENIYTACHILVDNHINRWELSNQENVFYTLSGYAFSNYMGWQRNKMKIEENIKKLENDIKKKEETGNDISEQMQQLEEAKKLFYGEKNYKKTKEILKNITIDKKENK